MHRAVYFLLSDIAGATGALRRRIGPRGLNIFATGVAGEGLAIRYLQPNCSASVLVTSRPAARRGAAAGSRAHGREWRAWVQDAQRQCARRLRDALEYRAAPCTLIAMRFATDARTG